MKKNNNLTKHISLIIPVYNASRYLRKCLDSVINQTLKEIEIIIVNDCSPDPEDDRICQEYANKDSRIVYIQHKQNLRQGGARNTAVEIAKSDYLWFIDSDDWVDTNACETLYNTIIYYDLDILAFSAFTISQQENAQYYAKFYEKYYLYQKAISLIYKKYQGLVFFRKALIQKNFNVSSCLNIFKKNLFTKNRFEAHVFHEDSSLIPIIFSEAESVMAIDYKPYYRLKHQQSITGGGLNRNLLIDKYKFVNRLISYLSTNNIYSVSHPLVLFMLTHYHKIMSINYNLKNVQQQKNLLIQNYCIYKKNKLPIVIMSLLFKLAIKIIAVLMKIRKFINCYFVKK